ncbi:50S ribosomal protein L11 methyltransferase [Sediminibacterium sp.]|uniref:50S ribosomal protein L11 methyltransferase n=1 Tax=Sediminibacterium sp. TaxID=1917865 RepID=UPI002732B379|nr:50S ribosomal protein L11 methyltransferase [Sediminibacterium sp.]MDP3393678.1 50S ribosomal protein L11 methyltransferase [Sediminibacterium sp.]MDP3566549.1 50S ribosomal protein L11 methyltransferase [Sediminibacterium sp.]
MTQQYQEVIIPISNQPEELSEILIAQLAEIGYDGFLEETHQLKAYISADEFNQQALTNLLTPYELVASINTIEKQNWNILWESNFSPMQVDQFVGVRASFHEPIKGVKHELIITPKMSFGTGHHGTTYSVMKLMEPINFKAKKVFDFGTGTGILAILAEKLGAALVMGVDNDPWCIENAGENVQVNNCKNIHLALSDTIAITNQYDIVIANINRHILEANMLLFPQIINQDGILILSGLLISDELDMIELCKKHGFKHEQTMTKDGWVAIQFSVK